MDFNDDLATLGVSRTATQPEVKRAYRKLPRCSHPVLSQELDAETRFKAVAEAHEAFTGVGFSKFFESLFGRAWHEGALRRSSRGGPVPGRDHHARLAIDLLEPCAGAMRTVPLPLPHPVFRIEVADLGFELLVAPCEAALGATVTAPALRRSLAPKVPASSAAGRRLHLKGQGLQGAGPGDRYALRGIVWLPPASGSGEQACRTFSAACTAFGPRAPLAG